MSSLFKDMEIELEHFNDLSIDVAVEYTITPSQSDCGIMRDEYQVVNVSCVDDVQGKYLNAYLEAHFEEISANLLEGLYP